MGYAKPSMRDSVCWHIASSALACLIILVVCLCGPAQCAGGVGHYYIAMASISSILQSPNVPDELKTALKDPACVSSFCSGAIAPDLECLVQKSHHGRTGRLVNSLLDDAETAYLKARQLPDADSSKPGKVKEALKGVCFAAGWLSHCATDVAVHPKVNARSGDAYEFCSTGKKGVHTVAEIQLSRYLANTYKKQGWKVGFDIPYWLVSKSSGVTEQKLQASVKTMRMKLMAEVAAAGKVTIAATELQNEWQTPAKAAMDLTLSYVSNPGMFKSYDLDYGPITTDDFRELRKECIGINGGTVPDEWGRDYLNWWSIVKSMDSGARHQKLIELIKGRQPMDVRQIVVRPGGSISAEFYVNGVKMASGQDNIMRMPANRILRVQVSADTGKRWLCRQGRHTGSNVRVLEQTPYSLHYTSTYRNQPYEYDLSLLSETYTWKPTYTWNTRYGAGTGKAFSTGKHPNVKNDVFEWTLPQIDKIKGGQEMLRLFITADLDWNLSVSGERPRTESERNIALSLEVKIPTE